jgi:hypothetical protein
MIDCYLLAIDYSEHLADFFLSFLLVQIITVLHLLFPRPLALLLFDSRCSGRQRRLLHPARSEKQSL